MLRIRLQRVGRKNIPIFRVVLTDRQNSTKSGKYLETLGSYDPRQNGIKQFDADRIKYWLSKGAKLTDTLHNLLINEKIVAGKKINVLPSKSPIKKEEKKETSQTPVSDTGSAAGAGAADLQPSGEKIGGETKISTPPVDSEPKVVSAPEAAK